MENVNFKNLKFGPTWARNCSAPPPPSPLWLWSNLANIESKAFFLARLLHPLFSAMKAMFAATAHCSLLTSQAATKEILNYCDQASKQELLMVC